MKPHTGLLITVLVISVIIKAPILFMLMFMALVFFGGLRLVLSAFPQKKLIESKGPRAYEAKNIPAPKTVRIAGVGEVEWITDPSQLDHKRLLDARGTRRLENELLRTDPRDWRAEGEKVAISEEEAANRPEYAPAPQDFKKTRPTHNLSCRCQDCWGDARRTMIHGHAATFKLECTQCRHLARELRKRMGPSIAGEMLQQALTNAMRGDKTMVLPTDLETYEVTLAEKDEPVYYYASGGIVSPPSWRGRKGPRLADHMVRRWG